MDESLHEIHQSRAEWLEVIFFFCLAFLCFCLGIYYWVRLSGVFPVENWRFDLMGWPWKSLATGLAVLYPVAACGLWLQSKWGVVLWLAGAICEACCYLLASSWFGYNPWLPFLHLVLLVLYLTVRFYHYRLAHIEEEGTFTVEY